MNRIEQKQVVLAELNKGSVDTDKFNGENIVRGLAITVVYNSHEERDDLLNILKVTDIKPEFIIEGEDNEIYVWWFSQQNNVIMNKEQYLSLINEFIDYVENLSFREWSIDLRVFEDSLIELDCSNDNNTEIVVNPSFNRKNFGLDGNSKIHLN